MAHVGKVLMREQFDQSGGHFGNTRLGISAVAGLTLCPQRFVESLQVVDHIIDDALGEVAASRAASAIAEPGAAVGGIDAHGAHNGRVGGGAGIGVQGKRQVNRDSEALVVGQFRRTSGYVVDPQRAAIEVIGIVVFVVGL